MAVVLDPAGTDNYRFDGTPPVSGRPMSMSCNFIKTASGLQCAMWIGDKDSFGKYYALNTIGTTNWSAQLRVREQVGGDSGEVDFSGTTSTDSGAQNQWNWMGASIDSSNVIMYSNVDGGFTSDSSANTTDDPGAFDRVAIGMMRDSSPSLPFTGRIAQVAMWDVVLTAGEFRTLRSGVSPLRVRPASLKMYVPGIGTNASAIDFSGGGFDLAPFDNNVAATIAYGDHAPVGPMFGFDATQAYVVSAAPGGLSIPIAAYHYNHHLGSMN